MQEDDILEFNYFKSLEERVRVVIVVRKSNDSKNSFL